MAAMPRGRWIAQVVARAQIQSVVSGRGAEYAIIRHPGSSPMSALQLFAFGRSRGKEAQLAEQVTTLQTTLTRCRELAMRWRRLRSALIGAVAVLMFGFGFVLGVYHEPIGRSVAHLAFRGGQPNADTGYIAYQKGDYDTALRLLRPLAETGDARAQFNLGVMYSEGQGVPQDNAEAGKWYRLSAEQGYAQAQY